MAASSRVSEPVPASESSYGFAVTQGGDLYGLVAALSLAWSWAIAAGVRVSFRRWPGPRRSLITRAPPPRACLSATPNEGATVMVPVLPWLASRTIETIHAFVVQLEFVGSGHLGETTAPRAFDMSIKDRREP
jgi:hypothetical protein